MARTKQTARKGKAQGPPMDDDDEVYIPPSKRPRPDDADIEIKLTFGDGEEKSYFRNSVIFSRMSDFIEAALSANMQESRSKEIKLDDVTPEVFEQAIKYLESPKAARRMTYKDAMKVVEFYNKYQFTEGVELCDDVCSEHIQQYEMICHVTQLEDDEKKELVDMVGLASLYNLKTTLKRCDKAMFSHIREEAEKRFPDDFDFVVEMTVAAAEFELQKSKKAGIEYIVQRLGYVHKKKTFGVLMFTEEHIKLLQPLFVKGLIPRDLLPPKMRDNDAILENPMFPELFVMYTKVDACLNLVEMKISGHPDLILFVDDGSGSYCTNAVNLPGIGRCKLCLCQSEEYDVYDGDWEIFCKNKDGCTTHWHCPGSGKLQYPPAYASAWKTVKGSLVKKSIEKMSIGIFSIDDWYSSDEEGSDEELQEDY